VFTRRDASSAHVYYQASRNGKYVTSTMFISDHHCCDRCMRVRHSLEESTNLHLLTYLFTYLLTGTVSTRPWSRRYFLTLMLRVFQIPSTRCSKYDVITLRWCTVVLLSIAATFGHVFPVSQAYTTTLMQQFTVAEEQPAGTLIGRVTGVRPPLRAYFRAGSDAERDLTVGEDDGSIRARYSTYSPCPALSVFSLSCEFLYYSENIPYFLFSLTWNK